MENLFEKMTDEDAMLDPFGLEAYAAESPMPPTVTKVPDDAPMSILKQVQECYDYFYSPGMSVLVFESKFDRLKIKVDKEIESRKV